MDRRRNYNYIPPLLPTPPPHFMIRNTTTTTTTAAAATVYRHQTHLLYTENHRLAAANVSLAQSLAAAQQELRHLSTAAGEVKAEKEKQVREVEDRAVEMESQVKVVGELNDELVKTLGEVRFLVSGNKEVGEKLKKVKDDVAEVVGSDEWKQVLAVRKEIEIMKKEIEIGRAVIEHERKVYDSSIKQSELMENYKIMMAGEIMKQQVEVSDAAKRARAAAALEAALVPCTSKST